MEWELVGLPWPSSVSGVVGVSSTESELTGSAVFAVTLSDSNL